MVHASQFPSAVFLSVTSAPSIQISSCDAVVQVYEVKITADTGATECYAWSIGTNYTTIPQEDIHLLLIGEDDLVGHDLYRREGGIFLNMWETNQSLLSPKIGSIGVYTSNRTGGTINIGLSSAGMPNAISVEVRRIGYVTVTNGSVALYEDAISANEPVAYAQLSKYEDGFIYNTLVPTEQLSQIDLFDPPS